MAPKAEDVSRAISHALDEMIATSAKKRHEIDGSRIRAYYGHSVEAHIERPVVDPPDILFHGTSPEAWVLIQSEGLRPMSRQSVHLSVDVETAGIVGRRKSTQPVVLTIDARAARASGTAFSLGNENVWLAEAIAPEFIQAPTSPG